jgi:hypothetical protein
MEEKAMRNVIFGGIGVLLGGVILLAPFLRGETRGGGAYSAGQMAGSGLGLLLFAVGLYYLIIGIRSLSQEETKPKPRKRKRRPVEVDE